jgi:molybdopterin synthase sulfur carrier subunit
MLVKAYATLRDMLGTSKIEVALIEPVRIGDVLRRLTVDCPPLGDKLWDANGKLTGLITVFVNGRAIQYLQGLDTPVTDDDTISLFPPVGGG